MCSREGNGDSNQMRDTTYFELVEALQGDGCALCHLGQRTVRRWLDAILFESVNDPSIQENLKATQGFCPGHSELLISQTNSVGTAILYGAILDDLSKTLAVGANASGGWRERLTRPTTREEKRLPPPGVACPACEQRDEATARYLKPMATLHKDEELYAAFAAGSGFCVPHLRQAMTTLKGEALEWLLQHQRERWEALRAELAELIRKNDYRYQHEGFGLERDSWIRAVRAVKGEPGVF
jgi:hypothetical protein